MNNKWNIDVAKEREFWKKKIFDNFIKIPQICESCNHGAVNLINQDSEINPFLGKCNNYKCKKNIYLRKGTIFEKHKHTPVSVLYNIMELWIYDEFNVKKIKAKIEDIYSINNIDQRVIYSFIADLRIAIDNFIRSTYCIDPLAYKNANQYI